MIIIVKVKIKNIFNILVLVLSILWFNTVLKDFLCYDISLDLLGNLDLKSDFAILPSSIVR
jgi:hypothetical protein